MPAPPTIQLRFPAGINNRAPETKLPNGTARGMVNLDISDGVLALRHGRTLLYPDVGIHSLWSHDGLDFALYVQNDTLYYLGEAGERTVLREGLQPREMSYTHVNGRVYYSNGVDTGCVTAMGTTQSWGVETPRDVYQATAATGGGLPAGEYQVSLTFVAGKEESAAPPSQLVTVDDNGSIVLTGLPSAASPDVTALRVYVSNANDPRLFHARDVALGMPSVTLVAGSRGRALDTQFLLPAPPGRFLLAKNGRIFSASGRLLRWTESLRYGLYDPANNYLVAAKPITALTSPDGPGLTLYIGTATKTYVFQGDDIADARLVSAAHTGIAQGSVVMAPHEMLGLEGITYACPVWIGTNGLFYVGTRDGILPLNKGAAATVYGKTAAMLMEHDGSLRYIAAGAGGKTSGLAVSDRVVARVVEIGNDE